MYLYGKKHKFRTGDERTFLLKEKDVREINLFENGIGNISTYDDKNFFIQEVYATTDLLEAIEGMKKLNVKK